VLSGGSVVADGPKHEVFANPRTLAVARLTGCKNIARMTPGESGHIRAEEWDCTLEVHAQFSERAEYVGIRAHDIRIVELPQAENTFPCWLIATAESPFETTLYLRLHAPPQQGDRAHVEGEVSRGQWSELSAKPQPWYIALDPELLLFLESQVRVTRAAFCC
jgi:molybdate transport system permease protein